MSIEQTLERLALAIEGLNDRLDRNAAALAAAPSAPAKETRTRAPRAARAETAPAPAPVVEQVQAVEEPETDALTTDAASPAPDAAPAPLSYVEDIQQPAMELVRDKGRQALVDVLLTFNARTAKDVPQKDWPALAAAIQAARS